MMESLPQDILALLEGQRRIEEKLDRLLALLEPKAQEKPKSVSEVVHGADDWLRDI